jgi:hypothetical protein
LSKDLPSILAEARESSPQDVEEAKCLLALVRAEREVQRAEAQLADRLIAKHHAWIEYNLLKAAKAWKRLCDAELLVGRARSILSENGFSCSELTLAMRRSKAVDGHQQIGAHCIHFLYTRLTFCLYSSIYPGVGLNRVRAVYI